MPIYEYRCSTCGHDFELRQGFDSEPRAICPTCQGEARRRISPVGVIFKGSGWYVKDYARKESAATSGSDSSTTASKSATSESATSESATSSGGGTPGSTLDGSKPATPTAKSEG